MPQSKAYYEQQIAHYEKKMAFYNRKMRDEPNSPMQDEWNKLYQKYQQWVDKAQYMLRIID